MNLYASLADVINAQNSTAYEPVDERAFLFYSRVVSRRIDAIMASKRPFFAPYIETRKRRAVSVAINSTERTFTFDSALLELSGVSVNDSALTVPSQVYGYPDADMPPFNALQLADYAASWYSVCSGCNGAALPVISISGTWGYHRDYENAWVAVDVLQANINDSVTSIEVADIDGIDKYGFTPRISAGNLIKIGNEMMEVTATYPEADDPDADDDVTVIRGVNGSTAAAHAQNDVVYVWYPEWQIRSVTARQAALMYARRGGYNAVTPGDGNTTYPPDLLQELLGVLQDYGYGA